MLKSRIYLAGPMRGIKHYNFPAFDAARDRINAEGIFEALSPADLDRAIGFDPFALPPDFDWNTIPPGFDLDSCIERDTQAIRQCNAIYMLRGWENSTGATAEYHLAKWRKMGVFFDVEPDKTACQERTSQQEIRVTDPKTGGQKGVKEARYDLIPPEIWHRLALHYGRGCKKYEDDNYRKGYRWKLSIGALQRHLSAWLRGEPIDADTGSHHLIAVVWHAIALQEFERLGLGTDDRYCTVDGKGKL